MLVRFRKNFLINYFYTAFVIYPVYINLSYLWCFGVLSALCLVLQMLTGIFLAMYYVPTTEYAFESIEYIMREVNYGWLIRYSHANGASFFFLFVYIHLFRNLFYRSYITPREGLWITGVILLILMILTAFTGYVLPWGQMSFWAATVITTLFSAIPVVGMIFLHWLWGGFGLDEATLGRFYSFHYVLPFIIVFFVILHLLYLHEFGSTNPLGVYLPEDKSQFSPFYVYKDLVGVLVFSIFFIILVGFYPNMLGHSDNYIPANFFVTPSHIVPEWYFLPFHAVSRSVPSKLGGVLVLALSIFLLLLLPYLSSCFSVFRSILFDRYYILLFWLFFFCCLLLGWIGGELVEYPFFEIGQSLTAMYVLYFLVLSTDKLFKS